MEELNTELKQLAVPEDPPPKTGRESGGFTTGGSRFRFCQRQLVTGRLWALRT